MKPITRTLAAALVLVLGGMPLAAGEMGVADAKSAEIAEAVMQKMGL